MDREDLEEEAVAEVVVVGKLCILIKKEIENEFKINYYFFYFA